MISASGIDEEDWDDIDDLGWSANPAQNSNHISNLSGSQAASAIYSNPMGNPLGSVPAFKKQFTTAPRRGPSLEDDFDALLDECGSATAQSLGGAQA
jgi:hypothetical protein